MFVIGGRGSDGALSTTELYDPSTGSFSRGPVLNHARSGHATIALPGGAILVIGGDEAGSAELFDPATGAFSEIEARLEIPRRFPAAVPLRDGTILVAGGTALNGNVLDSAEILNLETLTFSPTRSYLRIPLRVSPTS